MSVQDDLLLDDLEPQMQAHTKEPSAGAKGQKQGDTPNGTFNSQ